MLAFIVVLLLGMQFSSGQPLADIDGSDLGEFLDRSSDDNIEQPVAAVLKQQPSFLRTPTDTIRITGQVSPNGLTSLRIRIADMIRRKDFVAVEQLARRLKQESEKAKLEKCMKMFQSYAICTQTTTFFLWAQMMAKDIMNDNAVITE